MRYLFFSLLVISAIGLFAVPQAFADHDEITIQNAQGSSVPGCEQTADGCFIPSTVTIDIGGEVTWENNDTAAHTITSGTPTEGPDGIFDSNLVMAGSSFSHVFAEAGSYDYFCMVHPWMQGMVMVSADEMVHDEEMAHGDMEEMAHGDDHAAKGIEDLSDQFVTTVTSGVIHHIGGNTDDSTLLVHLFGADDDG